MNKIENFPSPDNPGGVSYDGQPVCIPNQTNVNPIINVDNRISTVPGKKINFRGGHN